MKKKSLVFAALVAASMVSLVGCGKEKPVNADRPDVNINVDVVNDMSDMTKGVTPTGYYFNIPDGYRVEIVYANEDHDHEKTKDMYYFDMVLYGDSEDGPVGKSRMTSPCCYKLVNDEANTIFQVVDSPDPSTLGSKYKDTANFKSQGNVVTKAGNTIDMFELDGLWIGIRSNIDDPEDITYIYGGYGNNVLDADTFKEILVNNF